LKIAIIGSSSIIGNYISSKFEEQGYEVSRFSRRINSFDLKNYKIDNFNDYQVIVDFAYDYNIGQRDFEKSLEKKRNFLSNFKNNYIYISSMSSGHHNNSYYSRRKTLNEELVLDMNQFVLRIGLLVPQESDIVQESRQVKLLKLFTRIIPVNFKNNSTYFTSNYNSVWNAIQRLLQANFDSKIAKKQNIFEKKVVGLDLFLNSVFGVDRGYNVEIRNENIWKINKFLYSTNLYSPKLDKFTNFWFGMNE
jgi:hypothetical protein